MQKADNLKIAELNKEIAKIETLEKATEEKNTLLSTKINEINSKIGNTDAQRKADLELKQKVSNMEETLSQKIQASLLAVGDNLSRVTLFISFYFAFLCFILF